MIRLIIISLLVCFILGLSACQPSDQALVRDNLHPELPGYSSIKIVSIEQGDHNAERILNIQAVADVYPEPVTCEGQLIRGQVGDAYTVEKYWFTFQGLGFYHLIGFARSALNEYYNFKPYQPEHISILLKHWIDKRLINLNDIRDQKIKKRVNELIIDTGKIPEGFTNASLFDPSHIKIHDLESDDNKEHKISRYVLRKDGTTDLYLNSTIPINLQDGDCILDTPYFKPYLIYK